MSSRAVRGAREESSMQRRSLMTRSTRIACALAVTVLAAALLTGAPARADVSVRIDIGNAPPPPHIVFLQAPHERRYAGDPVYVVDDPSVGDNDCFHYDGYYWVFMDGYWYRSASWRGPFLVYDPRFVPTVFYRQPPARWKHHPSAPPVFANTSSHRAPVLARRTGRGAPVPMNRTPHQTLQGARTRGDAHPRAERRVAVTRPAARPGSGHAAIVPARHPGGAPPGQAKKSDHAPAGRPTHDAKGSDKGHGHDGK
jgi:hypothetical protein